MPIRILRKRTAILHRFDPSTSGYTETGDYVDGTRTSCPIRCSIQPAMEGAYQKVLPEGVREKDCRVIHTKEELITGSEAKASKADYLEFDGDVFEVFKVHEWYGASRLTHFQALVIRRDKIT